MRFPAQLAVTALVLSGWLCAQAPAAPSSDQLTAVRMYAHANPYLNLPVADLRSMLQSLRGLKPGSMADSDAVLQRAANVLQAQMPRIPNLIAQEEIADEDLLPPLFLRTGPRTRLSVERSFYSARFAPGSFRHYEYVVRAYNRSPNLTEFRESRTELEKKPSQRLIHGTGFSAAWMIFVPSNLSESWFRYLGRQKIDSAETFVFAFAQDPQKVKQPGIVDDVSGRTPLLLQGVAWIDQKTFRIVRIRTDLLDRLPSIQLDNLTSTLDFSEVHIPELADPLWLPRQVEITWVSHSRSAGELHRYSNYQLFRSTVRILPE